MKLLLLAAAFALAAASPLRAVDRTTLSEEASFTEEKNEYVDQAKTELDELSGRIDALEARARKTGAAASAEAARQLKELKARRKKAMKDLARLKRASGKAWADIKAGFEKGLEELEKELAETDEK